mgnify:CR=1 FL=1
MQSHLSLFNRRIQWGIISCADDLDLLMTLSLRPSLIVPVTTWCHQCYPKSKLHHLIIPRANELDRHKENILKSSWGYTGTDASESNPSRVNCGAGCQDPAFSHPVSLVPVSPRWYERHPTLDQGGRRRCKQTTDNEKYAIICAESLSNPWFGDWRAFSCSSLILHL